MLEFDFKAMALTLDRNRPLVLSNYLRLALKSFTCQLVVLPGLVPLAILGRPFGVSKQSLDFFLFYFFFSFSWKDKALGKYWHRLSQGECRRAVIHLRPAKLRKVQVQHADAIPQLLMVGS